MNGGGLARLQAFELRVGVHARMIGVADRRERVFVPGFFQRIHTWEKRYRTTGSIGNACRRSLVALHVFQAEQDQ